MDPLIRPRHLPALRKHLQTAKALILVPKPLDRPNIPRLPAAKPVIPAPSRLALRRLLQRAASQPTRHPNSPVLRSHSLQAASPLILASSRAAAGLAPRSAVATLARLPLPTQRSRAALPVAKRRPRHQVAPLPRSLRGRRAAITPLSVHQAANPLVPPLNRSALPRLLRQALSPLALAHRLAHKRLLRRAASPLALAHRLAHRRLLKRAADRLALPRLPKRVRASPLTPALYQLSLPRLLQQAPCPLILAVNQLSLPRHLLQTASPLIPAPCRLALPSLRQQTANPLTLLFSPLRPPGVLRRAVNPLTLALN